MKELIKKIKETNFKYIHIAIIILGIIFVFLSIFHTNMWFDESYSVAMARHSFMEIWQIGAKDVHPILYYFCLHILYLIFGENIIVYRVFSAIMIALLGILGYTHIRKDFGEKEGILFSFLSLFLPVSTQYAGEIRMYSLGMLLGTIMAIYAYRIYKRKINKTTFIFFGISSLFVAYTHYYGLILAGIINLILLIYLFRNRKEDFKRFILVAIVQVLAYLPWAIIFIKQLAGVSNGFWISLSFPGTIYEILTMQFAGNLPFMPIILSTAFYAYIIYLVSITKKEDRRPADWCFIIYIGIILIALLVSLCMQSVILLSRYLLIATGLLIFALAFFLAKDKKKYRVITVCGIIAVMSIISSVRTIKENYNSNNRDCINYLQANIKEDDIIIYSNAINGAVITTELSNSLNIKSYFYDKDNWNVEEAYKSYSPYMEIEDSLEEILDNYTGRIWIVESGNMHELQDIIESKYNITKLEDKQFNVAYKNYSYTIELIEKK